MIYAFDFLNKNSLKDFGIYVEKRPPNPLPQRNITFVEVQGRDGSLSEDDGTYKDIVIPVTCWFIDNTNLADKIDSVKAWLGGGEGDLIFSNQQDKRYIARVIDQTDISQEYECLGRFQVNFRCRPYKYSSCLDDFILTGPHIICNPGTIKSKPVLKIYGSGNVSITINGNTFFINNIEDYVTVDSDLIDCYKDTLLKNNDMNGDFPEFLPGDNAIAWIGNISKIEVKPNWRWL